MSDPHTRHKALLAPFRAALYNFDATTARQKLAGISADDAQFHLAFPFETSQGAAPYFDAALAGLAQAWPDLEARDQIVMAGRDTQGNDWVGCGGFFCGTFVAPWLGIPPTGHLAHMRYHEFYRIEDDQIVEMQALWDIPEVMMQANAWPMVPSLGCEVCVPGPASQDGIVPGPYDALHGARTCQRIVDMLADMVRFPADGDPEVMQMPTHWHPKMNWYGPAGIGTARGIAGFRNWHQIPFLKAMPDRGQHPQGTAHHFFGDRNYAAVTGWPDMQQTLTGDGFLGLPPTGQRITARSLDFWRVEDDLIRENWVLVDLLHIYDQLGVDVLARMREFNKARVPGAVPFPVGVA